MERRSPLRTVIILGVAVAAVTLAVYWQVGSHEFINLDDDTHIYNNAQVLNGLSHSSLLWAFGFDPRFSWHPVSWLSHMLDVQLFGVNPGWHHLINLFIHTVSSLLLLGLLFRLTGAIWQSALVTALFALHPLQVEAVAWVTARKDVLCALFTFLCLILYGEYVRRRTVCLYLAALGTFVLSLMTKPTIVIFPFLLLLFDYWPLGRYGSGEGLAGRSTAPLNGVLVRRLVVEKLPFFAAALVSAVITLYTQSQTGTLRSLEDFPFGWRLANAAVVYAKYVVKAFWPTDLAIHYYLSRQLPVWQVGFALGLLALISMGVFRVRERHPYLLVGWLWFLIALVPVIGLVRFGYHVSADRYTYLPAVGLFVMVAWGVPAFLGRFARRELILALLAGVALTVLAAMTWRQLGHWQDSISIYRHSLQVAPASPLTHNGLGSALLEKGRVDEALVEYRKALVVDPEYFGARNNLGRTLAIQGQLDQAIEEFRHALAIDPACVEAHFNLAVALEQKNQRMEAAREYRIVLELRPDFALAEEGLDRILGR